jgi:hypothetical protein
LAGINNVLQIGQVTVRAAATSIITSDINNNGRFFASPGGVTAMRGDEGSEPGTHGSELSIFQTHLRYWDTSSSVWRTLGIPRVASLATVTNPQADDLAWLTTTKMFNRYTGSAWEEWTPRTICARLRQANQQTIATSVNTAILFDSEDFDDLGGHSTVSNTSRYTATRAGRYRFTGAIGFEPNASGFRAVRVWKNGSAIPGNTLSWSQFSVASNAVIPCRTVTVSLIVGDYVEMIALQNSGAGLLTPNDADNQATFEVEYCGA